MTGADLPNAFPYAIALERLVDADASRTVALLVRLGYAARPPCLPCLPCLLLLGLG